MPGAELMQEHIDYLDELRDSGKCNMFSAGPYVEAEFSVDKAEAKEILIAWMKHTEEEPDKP